MFENEKEFRDRRLGPEEEFNFRCHSRLNCFNSCCRNKRLNLFPYDLLRLRLGLSISSEKVLEKYIEPEVDPQSGWPMLRLRLESDGRCPFVTERGCAIYIHRPACCRIYPLARAIAPGIDNNGLREIFFIHNSGTCMGWDASESQTIEQWNTNQQLTEYHKANNRIMSFFMHPDRSRPMKLSERQFHAVIMALYNLDVFREAVSNPEFGERYNISPELISSAIKSDEVLLDLGQEWLTAQFFN